VSKVCFVETQRHLVDVGCLSQRPFAALRGSSRETYSADNLIGIGVDVGTRTKPLGVSDDWLHANSHGSHDAELQTGTSSRPVIYHPGAKNND
jgi:hypothetical protein